MTLLMKPGPGVAFFLVLFMAWSWTNVSLARSTRIAEPSYTVIASYSGFEVRRYDSLLQARTQIAGSRGMSDGFRRLARYIFGGNSSGEQISMTAPVTREESSEGWEMTFAMPTDFSMATLPLPLDERVSLEEIPVRELAVVRFSGWASERKVKRKTKALLASLEKEGVIAAGAPMVAQYDPPFRFPAFRRNEILVEIETAERPAGSGLL